jgi:hypothetical protein
MGAVGSYRGRDTRVSIWFYVLTNPARTSGTYLVLRVVNFHSIILFCNIQFIKVYVKNGHETQKDDPI